MKLNKKWFVVSRAKTYIFRFTTAFGESKMKGALNGHSMVGDGDVLNAMDVMDAQDAAGDDGRWS